MSFIADKIVMDGLTYDDRTVNPRLILKSCPKQSNSRLSFHETLS